MEVAHPERRLDGFWGLVDARHNALVRAQIAAGPVLDLGCGYGTLTRAITRGGGLEGTGVDFDSAALTQARAICPECRFEQADAAQLPFTDSSFGTVVMRDSLHHLVNSPQWPAIAQEIMRVLQPHGRVVVFDPNITPIVRASRVIARHDDEVCTVERASAVLVSMGLKVAEPTFNTLFSLPLSGGYVGVPLVPRVRWLQRLLLRGEERLERVLGRIGLLRRVAWRYVVVADRI